MIITVTSNYLWMGVSRKAEVRKLHFFCDKKKIKEIDIRLAEDEAEYFAAADLSIFSGREIEITGDFPEDLFKEMHLSDKKPVNAYAYRPLLHFTPETGWMNDPNGLVFKDGTYHLFNQWNPYGTDWGNMHWGHAVSRDLIHWEYKETAMEPDETGTMFSGSGFIDTADDAGFGKEALLFFYTAAGGANQWSREAGNPFTQQLAVSLDHGKTLEKKGLILDHIKGGNRDPKVFWHEKSQAYIMVLFLDGYEFAVFRSKDLLHWQESQRFSADKMRECPDLMELKVDNVPDEKKWVFWSADGYYMVGDFDGFRFTPESEVLSAYDTTLPYAAQTYSGIPDKTISIAWLRTQSDRGNFRGMMSIPSELSLLKVNNDYKMRFTPVSQLYQAFTRKENLAADRDELTTVMEGSPVLIKASWLPGYEKRVNIGEQELHIQGGSREAIILVDHGIIEYYAEEGLLYGAVEAEEKVLYGSVHIPEGVRSAEVHRL